MRTPLVIFGLLTLGVAAWWWTPERTRVVEGKPLAVRVPRSGPQFERLAADASGLQFRNELRPEHSYPYLNNGAGVAVGDIDADGLPDIYLVNRDGPNQLFRQVAPFRFENVTATAGVDGGEAWGAGASFADVDGDGDLDLFVCNTEAPCLLYVNRGDGRFDERAADFGLDFVGAVQMAAFADYDRDGDLDVYLLTNRVFAGDLPAEILADVKPPRDTRKTVAQMAPPMPELRQVDGQWQIPESHTDLLLNVVGRPFFGGQRDRLLRNEGSKFVDVTDAAGLLDHGMGLSATWWDYDDDGVPDLYVANDLESPDQLWHNHGNGTFTEVAKTALPHTAYFGMGADAADLDNDGRLDLVVADMSSTTHEMAKRLMGDMGARRDVLEHARPPQYMRNAAFLNTGTGRFHEAAFLLGIASTDWTWAIKLGDLDCDGWVDLFATNGIPRFDTDPDVSLGLRGAPPQIQVAAARRIPPLPQANLAFRNTGQLGFADATRELGLDHAAVSQGAAFADLDRDGDLDLVVNNLNDEAWLYRNHGTSGHRLLLRLRGVRSERFGSGARVTVTTEYGQQIRELTLARGYLSQDEPMLHFGLGAARRVTKLAIAWPSGVQQELHDLEADHWYTITEDGPRAPDNPRREPVATWFAEPDLGLAFTHRERPFDDYAGQPLLPYRLSQLGPGLAFGDADGDGDQDVFIGGAAGQTAMVLTHGADGRFAPAGEGPFAQDTECEDLGALWFDADADGDHDLLVVSGGIEGASKPTSYADRLYTNDRNQRLVKAESALPLDQDSGSSLAAADFDRDGDLDVCIGGRVVPGQFPRGPGARLLRNDQGRFHDATAAVASHLGGCGMVSGCLWSDVDADGWVDLLIAAHWQPLLWLRNQQGQLAAPQPLTSDRGLWNGLAGGDLDGDGDIDYLATNLGQNSKYKATPDHPTAIFADDFDGNGVLDIVEAKHAGDTLLPIRGRSCSSAAMPFLAEKFPTYAQFARASLPEIYSATALQDALRLEASELRHIVLRNDGHGRCTVLPLPRLAQIAPGFGIGIADFDGDGRLDAALAQNFYGPEPETGRMAGGLGILLRNTATGLTPVPPLESGIVMPQDAKALAVCDLDGDARPDLTATCNDGPVRAFVNQATAPGHFVRIRLRGKPGNGTAVGALVRVTTTSGQTQAAEVYAGAGYLSQGSTDLWFGHGGRGLREISVRWPEGHTTTHTDFAAGAALLTLSP